MDISKVDETSEWTLLCHHILDKVLNLYLSIWLILLVIIPVPLLVCIFLIWSSILSRRTRHYQWVQYPPLYTQLWI